MAMAIFSFAFAQERNVVEEKKMVPDPNFQAPQSHSTSLNKISLIGETYLTTDYDYGGNNTIPKMIGFADIDGEGSLDPFFTAMRRDIVVAPTLRHVIFGYKAFNAPIDVFNAFDPALASVGWGTMQLAVGGDLDGNVLIMGHSGGTSRHSVIDLENLEPVQPFPSVTFGGNFPDFYYQTDGTIWATNTNGNIYRSTNYGAAFDSVSRIGNGDPNVTPVVGAASPSENPLYGGGGGQYMATIGGWATLTVPDAQDGVYWYGTDDWGASWFGLVIGLDGVYGQVANNAGLAPYFENFGQLNANITDDGVTHLVMNGYGEGVNTAGDTVNAFPLVYWNSDLGEWYDIGVPAIAFEPNATMADLRPGNGIGQSYPSVSVTADGEVVFVIWTAPEYTGAVGASPINVYSGTNQIFYTDLHWAVSTDGGETFSDPAVIGEANTSETYSNVARRLELVPNGNMYDVVAHFVFFVDAIPGTSLFAANNENALGTWQYYSAVVAQIPLTNVDDNIFVNNFSLDQNYPNPFNPSTTISYSVAERSNVSIKVYDMLGKEVATVVNSVVEAGNHNVSFNASNLASGMYVYTITAGNFTSSKKMMLLK